MSIDRYLPADITPEQVCARIGLISDTHLPQRLALLPPVLHTVLRGADMVLHAGDVGALSVLDDLSTIAPVVAVHGNDDTPDAQRELPYQQVLAFDGMRMLLWHSHYRDRVDEMMARRDDKLLPKLDRSVRRAKRAGASVAIFGHWHVPLVYKTDGVLIVNPGALASGNEITRQLKQTVAILYLAADASVYVSHVDLADPEKTYDPQIDWRVGFRAVGERYSASILSSDMEEILPSVRSQLSEDDIGRLRTLILPLAHQCWAGETTCINREMLVKVLRDEPTLPPSLRDTVLYALLN